MSKIIENPDTIALDQAARAAGYAMAGNDDTFSATEHASSARRSETVTGTAALATEQARTWLRHVANVKPTLSLGTGWSPWKATA